MEQWSVCEHAAVWGLKAVQADGFVGGCLHHPYPSLYLLTQPSALCFALCEYTEYYGKQDKPKSTFSGERVFNIMIIYGHLLQKLIVSFGDVFNFRCVLIDSGLCAAS